AVALALAVAVGLAVPAATPVRAAGAGAKVVIIVGATHGATESYRDRADQAYAEAIKHTPNVVKVYSPNATWSKVKAATVGASIVIYFGHGNGWPSPYTYDPKYTTKDGFGLNATAGNGDYNNKYYGEPSVATLDLAPNAIVMLHHLCYASGNSEPGDAQPSVSVAKQRIDNYGAGFLRSNAQVVLADGHTGPAWYLRQIFTTNQSIEQVWRNHPGANGHVSSFNSSRTSGAKAFMDPETPTSGFYRSLIGDPDLTTTEIAGGFAVPGRAAAEAAGAPLYDAPPADVTAAPSTVLPADTRLTILERVSGTGEDAVFRVEGLDDDSITGYAIARDLDPKDSLAPRLNGLSGSGGKAYSTRPTGGTHTVSGALTEPADWTITIKRGSTTYASKSGTGTSFSMTWDPVAAGDGDGAYDVRVTAVDAWANAMSSPGTFTIDSTPPTGAISLDDGAGSAVVGIVRAGLQGTDALSGVAVVRLANVADLDGAGVLASGTTFDRAESIAWTLSPGTGDRRVYAQWRDVAGNWSEVESDVIAVDPPDTTFTPLTPVRLLDTRAPVPSGVAKLKSSVPLRFQVAGRGGVPGDAIAVTGNLTVVGQTASGYVTLGPIVGPSPSTSTINIPKGDVRANGVVVALDRSGRLEAVYKAAAGATNHLVLDVTGYFTAGDGGSR
ncbi:MAG TPA: hypothetical protein VFT09_10700, partial [Ilumatobacteraceae bacterium]|nr:hypothetical protein [Ilumatobacteraceae bacterium]